MALETYLAFLLAAALLIVIPGPSVMVVIAHAMAWGERRSLFTILGIALSHSLFFAVTAAGVAAILGLMASLFTWVKLAGAAYLIWMGLRQWRAPARTPDMERAHGGKTGWSMFLQGFAVNTTNPKALLFYAAFFPPFLNPAAAVAPQLLILGATFVALLILISLGYAIAAARVRRLFSTPRQVKVQNRISGTLMIGAGVGLAAAGNR
jgi:threonine/homoserine/homoserine lactone efflux protein